MEKYNYMTAIMDDVNDYIENEITLADYTSRDALEEYLNDELWVCDSVTGNASGSYYCNAWRAEEAIAHNWDLLQEACEEFGCTDNVMDKGAEWADVTIRCYLLGQAIAQVLDELDYDFDAVEDETDD